MLKIENNYYKLFKDFIKMNHYDCFKKKFTVSLISEENFKEIKQNTKSTSHNDTHKYICNPTTQSYIQKHKETTQKKLLESQKIELSEIKL